MGEDNKYAINSSAAWVPGVGSSYSNGWRGLKKYFLELLLITVIGIVIGVPFGLFRVDAETAGTVAAVLGILGFAYSLLLVLTFPPKTVTS